MKVNKVLKELKKIRNEYGNIEVRLFDVNAWDSGRDDDDTTPLDEVYFDEKTKRIVLY